MSRGRAFGTAGQPQRRGHASQFVRVVMVCLLPLMVGLLPSPGAPPLDRSKMEVRPHPQDMAAICPRGTGSGCTTAAFLAAYHIDDLPHRRFACVLTRNGGKTAMYDPQEAILVRVEFECAKGDAKVCRPRVQGLC